MSGSRRSTIRPPTQADEASVREFLEGLSTETRFLRYHTAVPRVKSWMVDAVVRADHALHGSLLALLDGRVVGIAEWGRVDRDDVTADVAVVVREDCRRHGIARALMRRLVRDARSSGVESFSATVLSTNRGTVDFTKRIAPVHTTTYDGSTIDIRIPLSA